MDTAAGHCWLEVTSAVSNNNFYNGHKSKGHRLALQELRGKDVMCSFSDIMWPKSPEVSWLHLAPTIKEGMTFEFTLNGVDRDAIAAQVKGARLFSAVNVEPDETNSGSYVPRSFIGIVADWSPDHVHNKMLFIGSSPAHALPALWPSHTDYCSAFMPVILEETRAVISAEVKGARERQPDVLR